MRLRLSQPSLAGVGAGAELGNMTIVSVIRIIPVMHVMAILALMATMAVIPIRTVMAATTITFLY